MRSTQYAVGVNVVSEYILRCTANKYHSCGGARRRTRWIGYSNGNAIFKLSMGVSWECACILADNLRETHGHLCGSYDADKPSETSAPVSVLHALMFQTSRVDSFHGLKQPGHENAYNCESFRRGVGLSGPDAIRECRVGVVRLQLHQKMGCL